jgi:hypothetical protein
MLLLAHLAHIYMNKYYRENFENDQSALPKGIPKKDIPFGEEDMYILKSEVVPPVCPKCPDIPPIRRETKCPACKPCGRCPQPDFTCKKVPNYAKTKNNKLPLPLLNDFSAF